MFGMFFANIFDAKVINNEAECDRAGGMLEESWDAFGLMIAVLGEVGDEFIIGKASCLWKPIHSFPDFHVDIAIVVG